MHEWVWIGTQRSAPETGIRRAAFDPDTGELAPPELVAADRDPSFLVTAPDNRHLYVCNSGTPGGVTAYALDSSTGALGRLNHHVSRGRGPSQLSLDRSGRFALAANYGGGYLEVLALDGGGGLDRCTAFVEHEGHSVRPDRQSQPHVHCLSAVPSNRFLLAADLGTDRVVVYRFDEATGAATVHNAAAVRPGSGPRHLAWHPLRPWLYLIQELSNEVLHFAWDDEAGLLMPLGTVSTLPDRFVGENTAAEVLVHASGRFLYASNRGHDSIAVFAVSDDSGHLSLVQHVPAGGRTPRYMAFDRTGRWLLVANCDGDSVAVFSIDAVSGALTARTRPVPVQRPYGLALVPVAGNGRSHG